MKKTGVKKSGAKKATKKASAKKSSAKKTTKKTSAKKASAKKTSAKKSSAKKSSAKKPAAKKATKKASAKKSTKKPATKKATKKASAKKASAKKASAKKASAKKASAKKASAKKSSAKKSSAKKPAAKKSAKKASAKKSSAKKTSAKKTSAKKSSAAKKTAKKSTKKPASTAGLIARIEARSSAAGVKLPRGASAAAVARAERILGVAFPAPVRAWFLAHDGGPAREYPVEGRELLSLARIISEWRVWKELLDDGVFGANESHEVGRGVQPRWWIREWIPLTYDGAGNHHVLDLAPAKRGVVGQVLSFWHDDGDRRVVGKDLLSWLAGVAWGED
ncbi:MAG: SMI1/KNR4 family protein [Nannocystaceae bacterium]